VRDRTRPALDDPASLPDDGTPNARRSPRSRPSRPAGSATSRTRDHILDNVTAYWLTGSGASAARSYREAYGPDASSAGSQPLPPPRIPVGFSTFPGEIWRTPRSWAEKSYPTLNYFGEPERGGHFAAWEEPELFAAELRAAFRPLR
jgi:hypothetical protein